MGLTLALLNVGIRARVMQRPLRVANDGVLPIYVLHLPIVLAISYAVVQWPLGLVPKAVINVGLGVGVTLLVAIAAMRLPALRWLLGAGRQTIDASVASPRRPSTHPLSSDASVRV